MKLVPSLFPALSFSILAALACGCSSATPDADGTLGEARSDLLGAPVDAHHKWDVGICSGPLSGGDTGTCTKKRCSGTLVAPNVVLTAQHCVYGIDYAEAWCDSTFNGKPLTSATVRVTTADSVVVGTPSWTAVSEIHVPGNKLCQDDIALLVLDGSIPWSEAFPVRMSLGRDVSKSTPSEVAIVGRGVIADSLDLSTGVETKVDGDLMRRVLEHVPFVCASSSAAGCDVVDYSSPPTNMFKAPPSYFVIGASVTSGDSGSGVFDQRLFHLFPSVIGITSAGTWDANGQPNFGLVTRLDIHKDFIKQTMKDARKKRGIFATDPFSDDTGE